MFKPGQRFDRYLLRRELGAGGMGTVFKAENNLGLPVVLKILHPQHAEEKRIRERFILEGQIQFKLRHANIVRVTDIVEDHGTTALVADFLEGEDLEARLERGPVDVREALELSIPILDALQTAHEAGYVHRDIKPANVFLARDGGRVVPKLMDFGIAKNVESQAGLTLFQEFYGTPHFAAPEQVQSTKDVDARADLYSWGAVLYQMLTGRVPFDGETDPMKILIKSVTEPFPALPARFPRWLREIVAQATAKHPEERFDSAAEFQGALLAGAATLGDATSTSSSRPTSSHDVSIVDLHLSTSKDWTEKVRKAQQRIAAQTPDPVEDEPFDSFDGSGLTDLFGEPAPAATLPPRRTSATDDIGSPTFGIPRASSKTASPSDPHPTPPRDPHPTPRSGVRDPHDGATRVSDTGHDTVGFAKPTTTATFRHKKASRATTWIGLGAIVGLSCVLALSYYWLQLRPARVPDGWVRIEPGGFTMGSPDGALGRNDDEELHQVEITRPFMIMSTEVTRQMWVLEMERSADPFPSCGPNCPAVGMRWIDAIRFANALSVRDGYPPCYELTQDGRRSSVAWPEGVACEGYRLPTEAEWEYAARAGRNADTPDGDLTVRGRRQVDPVLERFATYGANSGADYEDAVDCAVWSTHSRCGPSPAMSHEPNAWGLYDMLGNAAEWVWDYYGPYPATATDPTGPASGQQRVLRGGSWIDVAEECRHGARAGSPPFGRENFGFRLVRTLPR